MYRCLITFLIFASLLLIPASQHSGSTNRCRAVPFSLIGHETMLPKPFHLLLILALIAFGSAVRFNLYPGGSHSDSWTRAYADP